MLASLTEEHQNILDLYLELCTAFSLIIGIDATKDYSNRDENYVER